MKISAYFTDLFTWGRRLEACHPNAFSTVSHGCASNVAHVCWCINAQNRTLFLWGFEGPCFTFASKLTCLNGSFGMYLVWKSSAMSNEVARKFCQHQRYLRFKNRKEINPKRHQHSIILLRISSLPLFPSSATSLWEGYKTLPSA